MAASAIVNLLKQLQRIYKIELLCIHFKPVLQIHRFTSIGFVRTDEPFGIFPFAKR